MDQDRAHVDVLEHLVAPPQAERVAPLAQVHLAREDALGRVLLDGDHVVLIRNLHVQLRKLRVVGLKERMERAAHRVHVGCPHLLRHFGRLFHQELHKVMVLQKRRLLDDLHVRLWLAQLADLLEHVLAHFGHGLEPQLLQLWHDFLSGDRLRRRDPERRLLLQCHVVLRIVELRVERHDVLEIAVVDLGAADGLDHVGGHHDVL
mmetsp:Transcript_107798/g.313780  ORF Transcript_107798/g.313780 Transcript_107798/m.313780 type:complete len:205 (+) Transcript_107798:1499-2113(+)